MALAIFLAVASEVFLPKQRPAYEIINTATISQANDTVGISDSDLYLKAMDPAALAKSLDQMQSLGVKDLRIVVPWALVETADGSYDWTAIDNMVNAATARGMGVMGVVTTTPAWAKQPFTSPYQPPSNPLDYGNFMSTLASRYAGKVSAYEVWNEPNAGFAFAPIPDPAAYTSLLKAAYGAIKAADPQATVIGGVLGSVVTWGNLTLNPVAFVEQMYASGAAGYFDALSFHPYQYTTPFSQGGPLLDSPLNQVTSIYQLMVANGDASKLIWGSEYGLPTSVVGEQNQADYIKDFLNKWSSLPFAGPAFLYTLVDRNSADVNDPESTFGVFRDDWTQKLAAQVIKDFIAAHTPPPPPATDPGEALGQLLSQVFQQFVQAILNAIIAALNGAFGGTAPVVPEATPETAAKAVAVIDGVMADDKGTTVTDSATDGTAADSSASKAQTDSAPSTEAVPSTPETTVPESTVPASTVPDSTVPQSTDPETSAAVPSTEAPSSTVPETTTPASTPETASPGTSPATSQPTMSTVPTSTRPTTTTVPVPQATSSATPDAPKTVEPKEVVAAVG
ncbi:cellulase family glycosylhydrolase [Williamsia sp.]|uniref:cellulase family glycosylhydrolase n=1 Tax=Williamsia sp. TaxID=1872085 RepID=UPI001A1DD270|nr:cellulase family glycosylhydrolase [Williamsia sp.]MBJ7289646.1 cellulase family glycosylhydrolase [Williamsia sp.]